MRVLAIDPGYERLGIAILEKDPKINKGKESLIYSECVRTSAKLPFSARLYAIGKRVEEIMEEHKPEILAIENLFFTTNQKTAMHVAEVRGAILYCAGKSGLEIREFTPLEIKMAVTGYGKADKTQVFDMTKRILGLDLSQKLDDEIDAIAIGITCFAYNRTLST